MASFVALNIEYDNVSDVEVDDTKELQIEEALKLYQAALKYHSEGPRSYDKAADAYRALFESDIFKYPESRSELRRSAGLETLPEYEELWLQNYDVGPVQLAVGSENAPNTLPQILHLSYKNHGQFLLDMMQYKIQEHLKHHPDTPLNEKHIATSARLPLDYYAEALDKDDSDVDLWRCTAAVATLVGSNRIARFCLEAVLDMGEESLDDVLGLVGVEETIALQRLQELSQNLHDDISLMMAPLSNFRRKKLAKALTKRLESHSAIPRPSFESTAYSRLGHIGRTPTRYVITARGRDWAAVGEGILQQLGLEQTNVCDIGPGVGVGFKLPEPVAIEAHAEAPVSDMAMVVAESPKVMEEAPHSGTKEDSAIFSDGKEPNVEEAKVDGEVPVQNGEAAEEVADEVADEVANEAADEVTDEIPEPEESNAEVETTEQTEGVQEATDKPDASQAPSRKRSPDSAGLPETADGVRVRSKRLRARETLDGNDHSTSIDPSKEVDLNMQPYIHADEWLFDTINTVLQKFRAEGLGSPYTLRASIKSGMNTTQDSEDPILPAVNDLYMIARTCTPEMVNLLTSGFNGENIDSLGAASRDLGLNAFLGPTRSRGSHPCAKPPLGPMEGLVVWLEKVNAPWTYNQDAAWQFLAALLRPGAFPVQEQESSSSYTMHRWSDDLKRIVVQMAVRFDDHIFPLVEDMISDISRKELEANVKSKTALSTSEELSLIEMIQTLFELHLDVYSLIKHPHSAVDASTQTDQKYRLERWSTLANTALNLRNSGPGTVAYDELAVRHIWATAFHISVCDNVSQAHVLACMKDLKQLLESLGEPTIQLQNNAVMPEISIAAVEQELSKINMKDFFAKVFNDKDEDPVTTIESLEPLLEMSAESSASPNSQGADEQPKDITQNTPGPHVAQEAESPATLEVLEPSPLQEMSRFLANGSWSMRLSLWQRLRQAYISIDYAPKVVSCHLRSIELLISETKSASYLEISQRSMQLLRWLHLIDEFVRKVLNFERVLPNAFECIDGEHLRTSTDALTSLLRVLHAFTIYDDQLRVGASPSPTFEGRPKPSFANASKWVCNLQVRVWVLLHALLKEGIEQNSEAFPSPADDRLDFLRAVHNSLGVRGTCSSANRELLHLLKDELLGLSDIEQSGSELCQVLLDLYGLKCAVNATDVVDHGCQNTELLTRNNALRLVGFLMAQAEKVPMKDLPKTDLKSSIDRVHTVLGKAKTSDDLLLNRRVFYNYIRSTINPLDLFSSLRGTLELPTKPISPEHAEIAAKGWHYLMGLISLSKFRSQKRLQSGPAEELNLAISYFTSDLEYSAENWETWYRLAQTFDLYLEENVAWTAEKLNSNSHEVFYYQRAAIHAYAMSVSCAMRCNDRSSVTTNKIAEMYAEFGNRMYSSTREPFSMLAFTFRENEEKHYSGQTLYKRPPFKPLTPYTAWRITAVLFKRSLERSPKQWTTHFMLGKTLWKMYNFSKDEGGLRQDPFLQEVMDSFTLAIGTLPNRRDSRKEPILEPHYKLVSIVHKLVTRKEISAAAGAEVLQATSYASKVSIEADEDGWEQYILNVLKNLRAADKSGWHHRMTARAAHVIYDDAPGNPLSAMGVKAELTQQMFTKTMVLQVWKPENERPGRHFVYTTRYLRFFVRILVQLGDRQNLELLARRLRRKPHEFFDHLRLWQETCTAYLKLLRRTGKIPEGYEDAIFKSLNHEEFTNTSTRLEIWCNDANNKSLTWDILREVIELKKINNGLSKPTLIDDLIGDTYAKLYEETGPLLESIPLPKTELPPAPPPPQSAPPVKPMSLTNVMNMDGASDAPGQTVFQNTGFVTPQPVEHLAKPRAKGVGRRELQRKAEACVARPVVTPAASIPIRSTPTPSLNQTVQVVIPRPSPIAGSSGTQPGSTTDVNGGGASGNGSVHEDAANDDADDESDSELSELEDEPEEPTPVMQVRSTMFPGLKSSKERETEEGASAAPTPTPVGTAAEEDIEDVKMEE